MIVELVNTGSELMCGRALNTHQQWLCRQLADAGYVVRRQVAVSDEPADIAAAVRESLGQADLVITTGGLGPTSDDRTREVIADLLGLKLRENREVLDQVRNYFEKRNRPMPERVRVEALVPEGAIILPNRHGTAPGLAVPVPSARHGAGPCRAGSARPVSSRLQSRMAADVAGTPSRAAADVPRVRVAPAAT